MINKRPFKFMTLAVTYSLFIAIVPMESFAAGPAITTTTTNLVNTILNGKTPPAASLGKNGDFYIDVKNLMFYGPKKNGLWPLGVSLKGTDGTNGKDGVNGVNGKNGIDGVAGKNGTNGVNGAVGEKGATGATGLTGATGMTGATGATGLTGAKGETGPAGIAGAVGAKGDTGAQGLQGLKGDTGAQGAQGFQGMQGVQGEKGLQGDPGIKGDKGDIGLTGPQGAQGIQGIQGVAGATGATGPSRSFFGNLTFGLNVDTDGLPAYSAPFGNFEAGKSYVVRVVLVGKYASASDDLYWQFAVTPSGASPVISSFYSIANVKSWRGGVQSKEVNITAEILIDGSSAVNAFNIATSAGHSPGSLGITSFTGSFVATQVGSAS